MMKLTPILSGLLLLQKVSTQGSDIVEEMKCPTDKPCATKDSCPHWVDKFEELSKLDKGSAARNRLIQEIRPHVCNKKEKKLCCPLNSFNSFIGTRTQLVDSPAYIPKDGECGINPQKTPSKVFGGKTTQAGDFPFATLLGRTVRRKSSYIRRGTRAPDVSGPQWVCGGTLINYWYVVTAAHCTSKLTYVRLGEWTVGGYGSDDTSPVDGLPSVQEFRIGQDNIIIHQEYKRKLRSTENDIALIRLPRKAEINAGVQFACLPLPYVASQAGLSDWDGGVDGRNATVIGWGYSCYRNNSRAFCKDDNIGNRAQQYLQVPVVRNTVCNNKGLSLTNQEVCAGGEVGKGSCRGDSGGGLFLRESEHGVEGKEESPWFLLGVVSHGGQACGMGIPDVYTRVSKYVDWIKQQISQ